MASNLFRPQTVLRLIAELDFGILHRGHLFGTELVPIHDTRCTGRDPRPHRGHSSASNIKFKHGLQIGHARIRQLAYWPLLRIDKKSFLLRSCHLDIISDTRTAQIQ